MSPKIKTHPELAVWRELCSGQFTTHKGAVKRERESAAYKLDPLQRMGTITATVREWPRAEERVSVP